MTSKRVCIAIGLLLIAFQLIRPRKVYAPRGFALRCACGQAR